MAVPYPYRPMAPKWVRYACMVFGAANMASAVASVAHRVDIFMLVGGPIVGAVWFAFGWYGGLPLLGTVANWQPPAAPDDLNEMHIRGLLTMRRRRWMMWATGPVLLLMAAALMPLLMPTRHPEWIVLILAVPMCLLGLPYYLSRCPRCGYGFFARSTSRAALLGYGKACHHCGLPLDAYKERAATDMQEKARRSDDDRP
jgi:hypothetical protein